MSANPKVLFLYTEMAAYTVACFRAAAASSIDLHVVRWPVNREAPFQFSADEAIQVYDRNDFTGKELAELAEKINPDLMVVSGWIDKDYVAVARKWRSRISVVLIVDNPWKGTIKQHAASVAGRFALQKSFSHCWVPGQRQFQYARRLGFSQDHIQTGFYSADLAHFNRVYERTFPARRANFPKRFLYVGRYVDFKGIFEMWQAFVEFRSESDEQWELWCVGTGDQYDNRIESEGIRHFGFLQPDELKSVIAESGVFILPSRKEPWGVVVHEFVAAGFPLICSREVGATEAFLQPNVNGYLHSPGSVSEIKLAMKKMAAQSNEDLVQMAEKSRELSAQISPESWIQNLLRFLSN